MPTRKVTMQQKHHPKVMHTLQEQ